MNTIKAERALKGLTQSEVAERLNISKMTLSRWECGKSSVPSDKLLEMSELFDCSTDYLLGITSIRNPL